MSLIVQSITAQSPATKTEFDSLRSSAVTQIQTDKYYESLKTIELLKKRAKDENLSHQAALAEKLFYLAYVQMHAYDKAEEHILEAIRLNTKAKDTPNLSINYSNLTHFYMLSEDYPKYEKSMKKARYLDQADSLKMKFYNYESEIMALFNQKKFDSLSIVSEKVLKELEESDKNNIAASIYTSKNWKDIIRYRLQVTFEFYLAYGLIASKKDLELGNTLLNKIKDKKLEDILWFSPRVYKQYYRINHYKAQYFLVQKNPNLDSVNYYQKKAAFYFDKTINFLEDKSSENINYLNKAIEGEMEIERLELISDNKEQESSFMRKTLYLLGFVVVLLVAFIFYYGRVNWRFKKINNTLDDKNTLLKQLHVHRNKFLAVLSHEIRTPMYALQELITNAKEEYSEEESEEFSLANYSLINLRHSVDNSLQFSRLNYFKDQKSLANSAIIIKNLIAELRDYYTPILMVNEVRLITSTDLQNSAFEFNRSKIALVLHNLIKNAIELEDVVQVELKVEETRIPYSRSKLKFCISDDGSGISKEVLDYVERGEIIITDENTNKGIKLGLILCNQILALHNSKLIFESNNLKNRVSFELELKSTKKFIVEPLKTLRILDRKKILYIDDNTINLLITKKIIESLNHDCDTASSGRTALEKVMIFNYDLILLDINMPNMDGFETSIAIHKINNTIPMIAYTALSEDEISYKCQASHISEVLTKPLDSNQFKRTLDKYFN